MNKIFFDIETTGFNYRQDDRIIEVAAVEFDAEGNPTGRHYHSLVNPGRSIPDVVVNLTGIDDEKVKGAPRFHEIAADFLAFLEGHEVIAHNGDGFDAPFINFEMQRASIPYTFWEKPAKVSDTLKVARQLYPKQRVSLDELMKRLDVDDSERQAVGHNALLDCRLLAEVYYKMAEQLQDVDLSAADHETDQPRAPIVRVNLGATLPSVSVSASEQAAHEKILDGLEEKTGQPCVFRTPSRPSPRP